MTKTNRYTYLLLSGCILLIGLSAYMLITQARDLEAAREELGATRTELAQKQSQLLVVSDALMANRDLAGMMTDASDVVSQACSSGKSRADEVRSLCSVAQWMTSPFGRFLAAYAGVAADRVAADSPQDWENVRARYRQLETLLPRELDPGQQWAARIAEGAAYSDYRAGNLAEAQEQVSRAASLDGRSAFVGLTQIKIACASGASEEQVQRMFSEQMRRLEQSIADPAPGMNEKYARLELDYFTSDAELGQVCASADLRAS